MNQVQSSPPQVLIHEACFDLRSMGDSTVILHGGAGPQDPRGEKASRAAKSLSKVLDTLFDLEVDLPLSPAQNSFGASKSSSQFLDSSWSRFVSEASLKLLPKVGTRALAAVALLEKDPLFNAGLGAALQRDGAARVSASYMDSLRLKFSSVINVPDCLHPSLLAASLQNQKHCMRDGRGALELMASFGIKPSSLVTAERFEQWVEKKRASLNTTMADELGKGTVGAVVVDSTGALAVATSTGGVGFEPIGRIGDSGTTSGNYATSNFACSCTGYGEQITDLGFAVQVSSRIKAGESLSRAFGATIGEASRRDFGLAAICAHVDQGKVHIACGTTEDYFVWAYRNSADQKTFQDLVPI